MSETTFPRPSRLTAKAQYDRVLSEPVVRMSRGPLRLRAATNRMGTPRLGVVVAKRVLKRAVDRNAAKRQIRESFRLVRGRLPPLDVVVQVVRDGPVRSAADQLWEELCERHSSG